MRIVFSKPNRGSRAPVAVLSRFQRYPLFLRLPRAARRAETGPSLTLGCLNVAPSALEAEIEDEDEFEDEDEKILAGGRG